MAIVCIISKFTGYHVKFNIVGLLCEGNTKTYAYSLRKYLLVKRNSELQIACFNLATNF
jgi:hypothetical protein